MQISIIIPCFNDEQALTALLKSIRQMEPQPLEIIVIDAANSSDILALCLQHQAIYLTHSPCRGAQLHKGAQHATGDALWFVHADSKLPSNALSAIENGLTSAIGGYFRFRFEDDGSSFWKRVLEMLINWRCRWGIPYGDQGLFCLHTSYKQSGGFSQIPLFEEVDLVKGLRKLGAFVQLPLAIGVNQRKWQRDGWLKRTFINRILATAHMLGASPDKLARIYYHIK